MVSKSFEHDKKDKPSDRVNKYIIFFIEF